VCDHRFKACFPSITVPGSRDGKLIYRGFSGTCSLLSAMMKLFCAVGGVEVNPGYGEAIWEPKESSNNGNNLSVIKG